MLLKSKLALKHEYPVYIVPKMFPLSSSESWKKIHNFAVRVQNHPRLEHLKSKSGITYNSPLRIAHVTDWVANWLGRDVSGDIGGGCLSIFLLPPPYSLFLYLSIGWVEFIICCEGAAHDKHASGREPGPLYHWEWMNDLTLTRPGEENTCSAGLGRLATCREGWEFLQQEGWGDGGMEKVEEEVSMCLWRPDINLERMLAYCPFVRHGWYLVKRGWII